MEPKKFKKIYLYKGIEVTEAGGVRRVYSNKKSMFNAANYHSLSFNYDSTGNKIVRTKDYGDLRVDKLVALAFFGPPRNGQRHVIHKDKVKDHCWKNNLQWATTYEYGQFYLNDPTVNTPDGFRLVVNGIYVSRDGEIKVDGKIAPIRDYIYDPDVDSHRAIDLSFEYPNVNSYGTTKMKKARVADFVAEAFIPIPFGLCGSVLIHKDGDYKNCKASNLEWVESGSEKYEIYLEQRREAIERRNEELAQEFNGHYH